MIILIDDENSQENYNLYTLSTISHHSNVMRESPPPSYNTCLERDDTTSVLPTYNQLFNVNLQNNYAVNRNTNRYSDDIDTLMQQNWINIFRFILVRLLNENAFFNFFIFWYIHILPLIIFVSQIFDYFLYTINTDPFLQKYENKAYFLLGLLVMLELIYAWIIKFKDLLNVRMKSFYFAVILVTFILFAYIIILLEAGSFLSQK